MLANLHEHPERTPDGLKQPVFRAIYEEWGTGKCVGYVPEVLGLDSILTFNSMHTLLEYIIYDTKRCILA